jgi:hypothetical protein
MSLDIKIKADDFEQLQFWVEEISTRLNFVTLEQQDKLKERLQKVMSEDLQKRFASSPSTVQGGFVQGGEYWKPLSESYLRNRPERVSGKIYIDTQNLMQSFNVGSPTNISTFSDQLTYEFGTRIPYAEKLQSMRQIVFFYDALLDQIAIQFLEWVIELPDDSKLEVKEK